MRISVPKLASIALPLLALATTPGQAAQAPRGLVFDRVFGAAGEPGFLHYRVLYAANGAVHHLDVWRDHDRRIKRVTDQALATYASRKAGEVGYTLKVLDLKRRISTTIDRTNLYRIGSFTDWYDLGHGLRHPKGAYRLTLETTGPAGMPRIARPCRWYALAEGNRTTHICWDDRAKLPLLIAPASGPPVWRVTAIDQGAIPAATFVADDRGFIKNDANRDIEAD
ncbi:MULTISPECIES: hypothetical protein [unclassified Sphingomonas]|uniref:hypothetical protein n=1 Tax=unclassified Sphingomonas TaxID=196159 RepID=UPI001F5AE5AC|nr:MULTISPECIES: hypothetical protein [unclassified Sphingomonas]